MNQHQQAMYQAFQRVEQFFATHTDDLGPVTTGAARTTFDGVVAALPTLASTQYGAQETAVGCTRRRNELRETLRLSHMRPIADIARITLANVPESVQLQAATDAVRQAVADRATARNAWVHATADVQDQLALGRGALRVLDSLIVARLRATNAPLIVAWNQTKRVIAKPGVPRGTTRAALPDITPGEIAPQAQAA